MGRLLAFDQSKLLVRAARKADSEFPDYTATFTLYVEALLDAGYADDELLHRIRNSEGSELHTFFDEFQGNERVQMLREIYGFARTKEHCHIRSGNTRGRDDVEKILDSLTEDLSTVHGQMKDRAAHHVLIHRDLAHRYHETGNFPLQSYIDTLITNGASPFLLDRWLETFMPGLRLERGNWQSVFYHMAMVDLEQDRERIGGAIKSLVSPFDVPLVAYEPLEKPGSTRECLQQYDDLFPHHLSYLQYWDLLQQSREFHSDLFYQRLPNPFTTKDHNQVALGVFSPLPMTEDMTKIRHIYGMAWWLENPDPWIATLPYPTDEEYRVARRHAVEETGRLLQPACNVDENGMFALDRYVAQLHSFDDPEVDFATHHWLGGLLFDPRASAEGRVAQYTLVTHALQRDIHDWGIVQFGRLKEYVDPRHV